MRLNFPLSNMTCSFCGFTGVFRVYVHGYYCRKCYHTHKDQPMPCAAPSAPQGTQKEGGE